MGGPGPTGLCPYEEMGTDRRTQRDERVRTRGGAASTRPGDRPRGRGDRPGHACVSEVSLQGVGP